MEYYWSEPLQCLDLRLPLRIFARNCARETHTHKSKMKDMLSYIGTRKQILWFLVFIYLNNFTQNNLPFKSSAFKNQHARRNTHNVAVSAKIIYLQLLLHDFSRDLMLISKNTESCRLNIMFQGDAAAAAPTVLLVQLVLTVIPFLLTGNRVLAHSISASLPCSLRVTHNYSRNAAECR